MKQGPGCVCGGTNVEDSDSSVRITERGGGLTNYPRQTRAVAAVCVRTSTVFDLHRIIHAIQINRSRRETERETAIKSLGA